MTRAAWFVVPLLVVANVTASDPVPKPPPVAARTVTLSAKSTPIAEVVAEIARQTGLAVQFAADPGKKLTPTFDRTPFWKAIDAVGDATATRPTLDGNKMKLVPRVGPAPADIDGPFRVAVKKVVAKRDFETAAAEYEVHLEVLWEPRFPVYLIDGEPRIDEVATTGGKPTADAPTGRVMPTGFSHAAVVRLRNVPRGAKAIDRLSGSFAVVAAEKLLSVEFTDLAADKPVTQTVDGVTVTLKPVKATDRRTEFTFDLRYPPSHPEFESFQLWPTANRLRLIAPDNRTTHECHPDDSSVDANGPRARADYFFPAAGPRAVPLADRKGWRAVYETPCPMTEQTVRFTLKGIELP
jgi:hypothetical protein